MNKPTVVIKIKNGEVVGITSVGEVFADFEIHDLDRNPSLAEEDTNQTPIEFYERLPR